MAFSETCSQAKVHIHLYDAFPIQNDVKKGDAYISTFLWVWHCEGQRKPAVTGIKWDTTSDKSFENVAKFRHLGMTVSCTFVRYS
jgi:hypothetical protein